MSDKVIEITGQEWKTEVMCSSAPVLVDFWAPWCGPCKAIAPVIDELAENMTGVKFAKVNVDENQQIANEYGIRSIPTLLIIKDGIVQDQMVGAVSKNVIQEKLNAHL